MKILLATLHAKYVHNSLALPCLAAAYMRMDGVTTVIREFTVNEPTDRILRALVAEEADVAAFSCYIWNIGETLKLASDLKQVRPDTLIVLGGPEASFGAFELMAQHPAIDCVVRGEGEETFRELIALLASTGGDREALHGISAGIFFRSGDEIIASPEREPIPELDTIPSPFGAGLVDLKKPLVYYESSRGCPFSCAFCMSSLERGVRSFSMKRIKEDLGLLMAQGAQTVKLVDRTFNGNPGRANEIWEFILAENRASRFHFEIAADLLTEDNFQLLRNAPAGAFRFEIGVQSGDDEVLARVGRKCDMTRLFANVRRLREETGVIVHLDLVAGLPGEDFPGFLGSLQKIFGALGSGATMRGPAGCVPHGLTGNDADYRSCPACHIQVEPLKVLKGSPMRKIAAEENYAYSSAPPYKVLRTPWLSFAEICRIETISRLIDLIYNSGKFRTVLTRIAETLPLSRFFATAAKQWEDTETLPNLSQPELFETLWRCAAGFLAERELAEFRDALCFDFCLADYPVTARLPGFFAGDGNPGRHGKEKEMSTGLKQQLGIAVGSRVRTFKHVFAKDYRGVPWIEGPVELLFVYISAPGRGLRVEVLSGSGSGSGSGRK
jgi:anaerobic magnesium-protoporphyrin IX monomethyl ester cyclase